MKVVFELCMHHIIAWRASGRLLERSCNSFSHISIPVYWSKIFWTSALREIVTMDCEPVAASQTVMVMTRSSRYLLRGQPVGVYDGSFFAGHMPVMHCVWSPKQ